MKSFQLTGTKRENLTKQGNKELRNADKVPCVIYGGSENIHFSAPILDFRHLVYSHEVQIVKIEVDGKTFDTVIQEMQFHPVSDKLLHIDFIEIHADKPVVIDVPVKITGTAEGQKQGGKLIVKSRRLKIKALPAFLPDNIDINVTPLNIGQSVRVSNLKYDGIEFLDSPNNIVVAVRITRNVVETPSAAAAAPVAAAAADADAPEAAKTK